MDNFSLFAVDGATSAFLHALFRPAEDASGYLVMREE